MNAKAGGFGEGFGDETARSMLDAEQAMSAQTSDNPKLRTQDSGISHEVERLAAQVVDAAYRVHVALGPGLMESVYETCMAHELAKRGLEVKRQVLVPVTYDGMQLDADLRMDLLVNDSVIVELKAVENLLPVHRAQVMTYLRLRGLRLAFLINFNVARIGDGGIRRIVL